MTAAQQHPPTGKSVFSAQRTVAAPALCLPAAIQPNARLKMEGRHFLNLLPADAIPAAFFDPQYRGILDRLAYGNEGKSRGKRRSALQQMSEAAIIEFIHALDRVLMPSGHLFLWLDKFHLCQGFQAWLGDSRLEIVDLVVWNKDRLGMGYRTRRVSEYCVVLQKRPKRAKGVWKVHNIPDVWTEKRAAGNHPHSKPLALQTRLIEAVSSAGDYVIDPAAGSFSVMQAALEAGRHFIGCDIEG